MNEEHPASHIQPSVMELRSRATLAAIALGAVMIARGWDVLVRQWSIGLTLT